MASSRDSIIQRLPQAYMESRDVEKVKAVWDPLLYEEMNRHLDVIKEGVKGFSLAHSKIRSTFAELEGDERAEMIIQQFLDSKFPGLLELIYQIDPLVNQYPSQGAPEAVMVCDDDDLRSFTMDAEPGSSTHLQGEQSMGPPPRPAAPLMPVTSAGPKDTGGQSACEPPSIPDFPEPLSSDESHGLPNFLQTAKRLYDAVEVDHPRSPESATKRVKSSTAPRLASLVTRSFDFREVEGKQYIFKDKRCGLGWLVVCCGPGQRVPFLEHPLRANVATDHLRRKGHPCHDSGITSSYELEDIVQKYTYRVDDPHDEMTEQRIRTANKKLKRENGVPRGKGKKSRKGKERAISTRSTAADERPETTGSDWSDQDDFIF